jgi:hypothetical protein
MIHLKPSLILVIVHNFSRLRNNLFIIEIPLHVSTLLGNLQVLKVVVNYTSLLLLNYNANFHILSGIHSIQQVALLFPCYLRLSFLWYIILPDSWVDLFVVEFK